MAMTKIFLTVALAGALAAPAAAQSSTAPKKPSHTATASKVQGTSGTLTAADKAFVKEAAIGGMAEVELGNLVKDKATNDDVKQFGDRMVTDHSKANDELKAWARQNNVTLPTQLDPTHKALINRLSKLSGAAFDKAYMRDMVKDHTEDVAKFRKESKTAANPDLKAWAAKTLPTLEDHLKEAKDTASKVGVGAPTAAKKTKQR
jgi:putative membrane protein